MKGYRKARRIGVAVVGVLLTGCYTLQPVRGAAPEAGTKVAFDVNDAGRVALGGAMGPEIGQIEGRLISKGNGDFLVAVSSIQFIRGGTQVWSGERINIKPEYIGNTYERRFSKGRTVALSVVVVGGIAAFVISRNLFGFGQDGPPNPTDTTHTLRFRLP